MNGLIASAPPWVNFGFSGGVHPLSMMMALLLPSLLLVLALDRLSLWPRLGDSRRKFFGAVAVVIGCLYVAAVLADLFSHVFIDHIEPAVTAISWLFWKGRLLYQSMASQERYSIPYGPYLYIIVALFQAALGPSIFASKLPGALAGLTSVTLLYITLRKSTSPSRALCWAGLAAALLLGFGNISFWTRPDPFILLSVVLGMLAATFTGIGGPLLLGLCGGVAVNLKIHAFAYFLPTLVLALRRRWKITGILCGLAVAAGAALLPFVAFHNILPANYVALLKIGSSRKFEIPICFQVLQRFVFMFLPVGLAAACRRLAPGQYLYLGAILLGFLLVLPVASLNGSGNYHLIPFIPSIALAGAQLPRPDWNLRQITKPNVAILTIGCAWLATCLLAGLDGACTTIRTSVAANDRARECEEDFKAIVRDYPGYVILAGEGSGETYPITYSRFVLAFAGMPIGVDPSVMMDYDNTGHGQLDFGRLVGGIKEEYKEPAIFVIPKNSAPFTMYSAQHIFPDNFKADFAKSYILFNSTKFYDLYKPRVAAGGSQGLSRP
jgi:hypothetical protein